MSNDRTKNANSPSTSRGLPISALLNDPILHSPTPLRILRLPLLRTPQPQTSTPDPHPLLPSSAPPEVLPPAQLTPLQSPTFKVHFRGPPPLPPPQVSPRTQQPSIQPFKSRRRGPPPSPPPPPPPPQISPLVVPPWWNDYHYSKDFKMKDEERGEEGEMGELPAVWVPSYEGDEMRFEI